MGILNLGQVNRKAFMLSKEREYQSFEATEDLMQVASTQPTSNDSTSHSQVSVNPPTRFCSQFADSMEMYANAQIVTEYLNAHRAWFCRCAHPMKVEPISENGYALMIGRFGAFGYEVEPKVGLELLPSNQGVYRIRTIPVSDYTATGYEVHFNSTMKLVETDTDLSTDQSQRQITQVEWQLDLTVDIHFPKFIHRLPKSLVQNTGDHLLQQIVRQVSRRLTYRVQEDFHKSLGLPFPLKSKKKRHGGDKGKVD